MPTPTRLLASYSPLLTLSLLLACGDDARPEADGAAETGVASGDATDTDDPSTATEDETGDGTTEGEPEPACTPTGLGEMTKFSLPAGLGPVDDPRSGGDCEQGRPRWLVRDLTGDGIVDLVVTNDCDPEAPPESWTIHLGTASGFSPQPLPWALPNPHGDPYRYQGWGCAGCDHQLRDIDGDGLEDLLVAYVLQELDDGHWWLHRGTGSGFEYEGTPYGTPPGNMLFWSTSESDCFAPPPSQSSHWFPEFFLEDLDGDGRVDMAVDPQCDDVALLEETRLDAYLGGPTAFASTPTPWTMPVASPTQCESSPHPIRLFDIDGDGRPEMVDPRGCFQLCEATQWLVYDAEANGFTAAPRPYAVPSHVACNGLTRPSEQRARWMDFTLDGVPDVLTADLEGDRWILDRGTDTGVEPGIELPTPTIADLPLVGVHSYSGDPVQFDIVALDESRPPALVVTARPDDPDVGQLHWEVYPFECAGP